MEQQQLPGDHNAQFVTQPQPAQQQSQDAGSAPTQPPPQYVYQPQPIYVTQQVQMAPAYVAVPQKSMALSLVLTFFFGPLGLFYATVTGGIVMLIVSVVLFFMTFGLSLLLTVPACMVWAAIATNNYNASLFAQPQMPQPPQSIP